MYKLFVFIFALSLATEVLAAGSIIVAAVLGSAFAATTAGVIIAFVGANIKRNAYFCYNILVFLLA